MVSADILRRAAALMRERAEAATLGPWAEVADGELIGCLAVVAGGADEFNVAPAVIPANADHIASWHPAVALAVADWLTEHAADHEGTFAACPWSDCAALAVARAFLGETS